MKQASNIRRQPLWYFPLFVAVLLVTGCGAPPINAYYTLDNEITTKLKPSATPLCKKPLGIAAITVLPPYDLTKIVFRPDALEVRYYANHYWVSSPEDMVRKMVARRLEFARLFSEVDNEINLSRPHMSLSMEVHNLEEIDKENNWQARLAMNFILMDEEDDEVVWRHRFDVTRKVDKKEIKSVIVALSDIYNTEIDKALDSLKKVLSRSDVCVDGP